MNRLVRLLQWYYGLERADAIAWIHDLRHSTDAWTVTYLRGEISTAVRARHKKEA